MATIEEIKEELKLKHRRDIKTLWKIYNLDHRFLKSLYLWSAFCLTVVISALILIIGIDSLYSISYLTDKVIAILPNILGFNLAGYVLLISMNSDKMLSELANDDENGYSSFQQISSIFAWSVLVQAVTLVAAFLTSIFISFNIESECADIINTIVIIIIMFLSFYSMLLILRIVLNVFSFSQIIHFFVKVNSIEDKYKNGNI